MRERIKSYAARRREQGRHVVNKIEKTVRMDKTIEDSKRCNISAKRKMLKTVSQRRGVDETKNF